MNNRALPTSSAKPKHGYPFRLTPMPKGYENHKPKSNVQMKKAK